MAGAQAAGRQYWVYLYNCPIASRRIVMAKKKESGIKLFGSRVLVEVLKPDEKSKGGVLLPGSVREGSFKKAIVKVLGQGTKMDDGTFVEPIVQVGDQILLPATVGVKMEVGEEHLLLVNETDIIGILN
jgi:chaperonin GroES